MPGIYWALKSGQGWKYLKMTSDFLPRLSIPRPLKFPNNPLHYEMSRRISLLKMKTEIYYFIQLNESSLNASFLYSLYLQWSAGINFPVLVL